MPLTPQQARALLLEDANRPRRGGGGGRSKADPTEIREIQVWFKLNHEIRETGCENPDCDDPRQKADKGVNVVANVKGKWICRYCFLDGYNAIPESNDESV